MALRYGVHLYGSEILNAYKSNLLRDSQGTVPKLVRLIASGLVEVSPVLLNIIKRGVGCTSSIKPRPNSTADTMFDNSLQPYRKPQFL